MAAPPVLGISLGTRRVGIAVVERFAIFECKLKRFKGAWSEKKLQMILEAIEKYIDRHDITDIGLKTPAVNGNSPAMIDLLNGIKSLAAARKCAIHTYSL